LINLSKNSDSDEHFAAVAPVGPPKQISQIKVAYESLKCFIRLTEAASTAVVEWHDEKSLPTPIIKAALCDEDAARLFCRS
jgi:hypothetical protein